MIKRMVNKVKSLNFNYDSRFNFDKNKNDKKFDTI